MATPNGSAESLPGFLRPQNKILENVVRTPDRRPSPQPTHLGVPGVNFSASRIVKEEGSGYIAPKFEGKDKQMEEGKPVHTSTAWSIG